VALVRRWAVKAVLLAAVIGGLWFAGIQSGAQPKSFRLIEIRPLVFYESKLTGEQVAFQAYHAHVAAYPGAANADMNAYADQIFSRDVRDMANRDEKTYVWVTFYLERVIVDGQERTKTFRIIFVREGGSWQRLQPTGQKAV
jgi:hypothetical protein